jgi:hypothetical protein
MYIQPSLIGPLPHFLLYLGNLHSTSTDPLQLASLLIIYAPIIYAAACIMFLMRADTLRGQVGGGWALEMESF